MSAASDTFDPFSEVPAAEPAAGSDEEEPVVTASPALVVTGLPTEAEASDEDDEEEEKVVPAAVTSSASAAAGTSSGSTSSSAPSSSIPEIKVADPFAYVPPTQLGPSKLALWEAERKKVISERINKAAAAKGKRKQTAQTQIAAFYKERKETIKKNLDRNGGDEAAAKRETENLMKHGTTWQKVAKQCSLKPKENESRDVDRMRKLLIQMKNEKSETKSDS